MATIQPNFNPASINSQFTQTIGTAVQQALAGGASAGSPLSSLEQSQQMLAAVLQLQANWMGIGGGMPIGDGSLPSLGAALSGEYAALTFGSPGNAADLGSLQTNLRGEFGAILPGMTDDLTKISPPLSSAYAQMMNTPGLGAIPGMPVTRPIALGEISTPSSMLAAMPKPAPPPKQP